MTLSVLLVCLLAAGDRAAVRVEPLEGDPARVEVSIGWPAAWLADEGDLDTAAAERWLLFGVVPDDADQAVAPMFGTYRRRGDRLVFTPRYPLAPGQAYRAVVGDGASTGRGPERFDYQMAPLERTGPPTRVTAIYPTTDRLPANLLKFYLHFSRPMREGREVFERIELIDEQGRHVPDPWRPTELWSDDATRLTLWLHPGRVKDGVGLRDQLGPILEPGVGYRLVVRATLRDADGQPMEKDFTREFTAVEPDSVSPTVEAWRLRLPAAGSRAPLVVRFPEPLDRHLLVRCLSVFADDNQPVAGEATVEAGETGWRFTPHAPWKGQPYQLRVDPILEDLAGNNPDRPFEVDLSRAEKSTATQPVLIRAFTPVD